MRMTGNETHGEGRRLEDSVISLYTNDEFTRESVNASARAGETAVKILKGIGNAVKKSGVLKGYPRVAQARNDYIYPVTSDGVAIDPAKYRTFREVITGKYEEKDQDFLQRITGKFKQYVYGANLAGRVFVHKYLKRESPEQYYATLFHEAAHSAFPDIMGEEGEDIIENLGKVYAQYLAENDPSAYVRKRADKAYKGFIEAAIERSYRRGQEDGVKTIQLNPGKNYLEPFLEAA
jgi:hypothetical protein